MTPFQMAFLSLIRRKTSSFLVLLSIALSVAGSGILFRLYQLSDSRLSTIAQGGDAIVGAKSGDIQIMLGSLNGEGEYPGFIPYKLFLSLKNQQNVAFEDGEQSSTHYIQSVIPLLYFGTYKKFRAIGTDPSFIERPRKEESLLIKNGRWPSGSWEVAVGSVVAKENHLNGGEKIPLTPWWRELPSRQPMLLPRDFTVVGILNETGSFWDSVVISNLTQAQEMLPLDEIKKSSIWGQQVINYMLIYLQSGGFEKLESLINKRTIGQVIDIPKTKVHLKELTGTGKKLGFLLSSLIITLGGLSVASMLITRYESMSLHMAVLRAIGFERSEISQWLLWEGFLLGLVACLLGGLMDYSFFPFISSILRDTIPSPAIASVPIYWSFPVWIASLLATIFAVFIPLFHLYQQNVHSSLKGIT